MMPSLSAYNTEHSNAERINPYLNDENKYNEIKIKIRDINPKFINGDIFKIQLTRMMNNV